MYYNNINVSNFILKSCVQKRTNYELIFFSIQVLRVNLWAMKRILHANLFSKSRLDSTLIIKLLMYACLELSNFILKIMFPQKYKLRATFLQYSSFTSEFVRNDPYFPCSVCYHDKLALFRRRIGGRILLEKAKMNIGGRK